MASLQPELVRGQHDDAIRDALLGLKEDAQGYWDAELVSPFATSPKLFQYPAIMVPALQGAIMDIVAGENDVESVFDPFMGSGTILAESVWRGLRFHGQDINPLAYLITRTRLGPLYVDALESRTQSLIRGIKADKGRTDHEFAYRDKWFKPGVVEDLCRIRRQILLEPQAWTRRFFWISLAETVRQVSNSRSSTVKLHIMDEATLRRHAPNTVGVFFSTLQCNLAAHRIYAKELKDAGFLRGGHIVPECAIELGNTQESVHSAPWGKSDLLVSSPPYGDNATTVPYGQASYLPLSWIDLNDIHPQVANDGVSVTGVRDRESLGGTWRGATKKKSDFVDSFASIKAEVKRLEKQPSDRADRVVSFFSDFNEALGGIADQLADDAWMIWTVGNRSVGGGPVRFDKILPELLEERGFRHVATRTRTIKHKRHAHANNYASSTMKEEFVVVARRE